MFDTYLKSKNIEIAINFAQDMATQVVQKSGVNVAGTENKKYTKINWFSLANNLRDLLVFGQYQFLASI